MIIHQDDESIKKFVKGDEKVFEVIYQLLQMPLYTRVRRIVKRRDVAEDIVAETFVALWKNRAGMKGMKHIERFAFITARNKAFDHCKKSARDHVLGGRSVENMGHVEDLADNARATRELEQAEISYMLVMKAIEEEVKKLPPKRQRIFRLHLVEGQHIAEIAKAMGTARSTTYNQFHAACEKIRKGLESKGIDGIL
jgi:RNA polymerase sigma-70 factor (ECF subfamily)